MDNFTGTKELKGFYDEVSGSIADIYKSGRNYLLAGTFGSGKSMSATNVLKLAALKNYSICYTTLSEIVEILINAPSADKYATRRSLIETDWLVIDEVDPRFVSSDTSADLFGRILEGIFRTRIQNNLPNILITNSPNVNETFNGALKQSLGSLMSNMKTIISVGKDHRKIIKE